MRSVHVVELLPDDELLPEIDVVGVVESNITFTSHPPSVQRHL